MAEKPVLQRVLEAIAAAMDLDTGRRRIELLFFDGRLERLWVHDENKGPNELAAYDTRARWAAEVMLEELLDRANERARRTSP
jgi:hypothetical protein